MGGPCQGSIPAFHLVLENVKEASKVQLPSTYISVDSDGIIDNYPFTRLAIFGLCVDERMSFQQISCLSNNQPAEDSSICLFELLGSQCTKIIHLVSVH